MLPLNIQSKWRKEVHTEIVIEDWSFIYCIPFSVTKDTKLHDFQYKVIHVHRILITNSFLYKCGLKEIELCTIVHKPKKVWFIFVGECKYVRNFWLAIANFLKIRGVSLPLNAKDIILGLTSSDQGTIKTVLIILKYYIYVCRCKCRALNLRGCLEFLKYAINIEKASIVCLSPVQKEHVRRQ